MVVLFPCKLISSVNSKVHRLTLSSTCVWSVVSVYGHYHGSHCVSHRPYHMFQILSVPMYRPYQFTDCISHRPCQFTDYVSQRPCHFTDYVSHISCQFTDYVSHRPCQFTDCINHTSCQFTDWIHLFTDCVMCSSFINTIHSWAVTCSHIGIPDIHVCQHACSY